jgi:hypothetical protein
MHHFFTVILQLHSVNQVPNLFSDVFELKKHLQKATYLMTLKHALKAACQYLTQALPVLFLDPQAMRERHGNMILTNESGGY